jgi:hypothetical protein
MQVDGYAPGANGVNSTTSFLFFPKIQIGTD